MDAKEHTPTPWSTDGHSVRGKDSERGNGPWLFDVYGVDGDAAFIVRAANCHDVLVAALKEVRADIWSGCDTVRSTAKIDAALAKAEGRS